MSRASHRANIRSINNEEAKVCIRCHEVKPLADFVFINKAKGHRQSWCRPCDAAYKREWYARNRERHMENARLSNRRTKAENRARVLTYLLAHPCVDCGETDPIVLEFDHLRDKRANVSKMVMEGWRWATIELEIAKCEIRCANCHRRKTARDFRWHQGPHEGRVSEAVMMYACWSGP